jgi:hypothetical protein
MSEQKLRLISKDCCGIAHPKHESVSNGKEYETFDLASRTTRLQ